MDRYEIMWRITQKYGYQYDLRKIGHHKGKENCVFGCIKHGWVTKIVDNLLNKQTVNGIGCPKCANEVNKLTWDNFIDRAKAIYGDKFTFFKPKDNDFSSTCSIDYICNKCGKKGHNRVSAILNEKKKLQCCSFVNPNKITQEEFEERVNSIFNGKYDLSKAKYVDYETPVTIICPVHGEIEMSPHNLFAGHGCKKCADDKMFHDRVKSHEQYLKDCEKVHGKNRYTYLSKYIGGKYSITFQCNICGRITTLNANKHLIRGSGCSFCVKSHLERKIQVMLEENKIQFIPHANGSTFKWIGLKSFDFYLPDYNVAIECQGEQHFSNQYRKCENKFNQIESDIIKSNLAKTNGINLIYFADKKILNKYNLDDDKFEGIYKEDNIFSNLDDLLGYISKCEQVQK